MEVSLLNMIIENLECNNDNSLLKYNKQRIRRIKRRRFLLKTTIKKKKRKIPKVDDYFQKIYEYPDDVFQSHFRMSRSTFKALESSLQCHWTAARCGRLGYSLKKSLYITLWKLGNTNTTFRELSDRFNVAKGTTHKIFYKTIEIICLKKEIVWPTAAHQLDIMASFQNSRHNPFPFVIGCIDGSHFNVPTPKKDAISYYNRKGQHTINMQAICDSKFRFLDVFIGVPGSCHDAHVWKISPILAAINSGRAELAENAIILGDSAYPLMKFLITPYRDNGHLTTAEKKFNYVLSSTRVFIEQTFGIFKQKFKILKHLNVTSIKKASNIIYACATLHNFIINEGNSSEYMVDDMENAVQLENDENNQEMRDTENDNDTDGITRRQNLTTLFCS